MAKTISIPIDDVTPAVESILKAQGVPEKATPDRRIIKLAQDSVSLYQRLSNPMAMLRDISKRDFETVYRGEGKNEDNAPLGGIYGSSGNLALFAVTLGEEICEEISRLFHKDEFALGAMLDAAASEGAEMAAEVVESHYRSYLEETGRLDSSSGIMRFSPGYCGWHVSAQKKLFAYLRPEEVGIELRKSLLMQPLKSVSGVIVVGPKGIFRFEDVFSFCSECDRRSCRDRIRIMLER